MRAVLVLTDTERGGTPNRMATLARGMSARGWQMLVVSLRAAGPVSEDLASDGTATLDLELHSRLAGPLAVWRLRRVLRGWRPNVVQSALWHANLLARLAALGTGIPVVNAHESVDDAKAFSRVVLDRATGRLAAWHVAVSTAVADRVAARDWVRRSRLTVIRNGIDARRWAPEGWREVTRARLGLPDEATVVGWTGRLHIVKDLPTLLGAIGWLPGWRLVVVGGGKEEGRLRQLAADAGLAERVVFTGEVDDVAPVLEGFDVFCLPSLWEGLPGSLMEAMAAGLPVVATRVGGVPELVTDGYDGLLVAPGDPEALAAAIATAAERPELGLRARQTVETRFSEEAMLDAYERLWGEVSRPFSGRARA